MVFVFPSLGIAIKFPIIRLFSVIGNIAKHTARLKFRYIYLAMALPIDSHFGYKDHLLGGIAANWREFCFFCKTKNPFLQPTYFSFLGLANIQKAAELSLSDEVELWSQLYDLTDGKVLLADSHHFENSDNFCFDNGKLKILDYGNRRTHEVITEFGGKIQESFDPKRIYNYAESKVGVS